MSESKGIPYIIPQSRPSKRTLWPPFWFYLATGREGRLDTGHWACAKVGALLRANICHKLCELMLYKSALESHGCSQMLALGSYPNVLIGWSPCPLPFPPVPPLPPSSPLTTSLLLAQGRTCHNIFFRPWWFCTHLFIRCWCVIGILSVIIKPLRKAHRRKFGIN